MSDDIRHEINHNNNTRDGPAISVKNILLHTAAPFTPISVQMGIRLKKMAIASN